MDFSLSLSKIQSIWKLLRFKNELFPQQPQHITNVMKIKKMYCCDFLLLMNEFFLSSIIIHYKTHNYTQEKKIHTHMTQYREKYRKIFHFQAIQVYLLVSMKPANSLICLYFANRLVSWDKFSWVNILGNLRCLLFPNWKYPIQGV